jgi:hypothetical protein
VQVSVEIAALTRANILGHMAREIVSVLDPGDRVLATVLLGIQKSWLKEIELVLYDPSKNVVGYLSIRIDWDKYSMHLETGSGGNTFTIDPRQPVTRQLSPLLAKAAAYISELRRQLDVRSIETLYTYRPGMADEARKGLGTSPVSSDLVRDLKTAQTGRRLKITDSRFGELTVEVRYQDPGSQANRPS